MSNLTLPRPRRCARRFPRIEFLEPRRLLASFLLADYFPTTPGATWEYNGTENGRAASLVRRAYTDTTAGATVRMQDDIDVFIGDQTASTYFAIGVNGAFLVRQTSSIGIAGVGDLGSTVVNFKTPLQFLKPSIQLGDALSWSNLAVSATVVAPEVGTINATGTDSGSSRVVAIEQVTLDNGLIAPAALKVVLDHSEDYSARSGGVRGRVQAHIVETVWLAQGIGVVKMDTTTTATLTADGESETATVVSSFSLSDSSLLPEINSFVDTSGVLNLNGTAGNDVLSVSRSGTWVYPGVNGVAKKYGFTSLNGICVYGGDGNDRITFGDGLGPTYALGGNGNDTMTGGDGSDTLTGAAGKDILAGAAGNDVVNGGKHNDRVYGNDGNDRVYGSDGNDLLDGGFGADRCYGGLNDDTILGGNHNDTIYGDEGNDSIDAGNHNDRVYSGPGADTVLAAAGNDCVWDCDGFIDSIDGGLGTDSVQCDVEDILSLIETILP